MNVYLFILVRGLGRGLGRRPGRLPGRRPGRLPGRPGRFPGRLRPRKPNITHHVIETNIFIMLVTYSLQ